jgi:hypothetical protein
MKRKFVDVILVAGLLITVVSGFAHTWNQATTLTSAGATAMSADGRIICVVNSANHPVISTNSGATWAVATNSLPHATAYLGTIAVSADGGKIFAALTDSRVWMFVSTDQGATWAKTGFPSTNFSSLYSVACSADGTKVVTGLPYNSIFYSTNGGINCYTSSIPNVAASLASSADGSRMIAGMVDPGGNDGGVYFSGDFGATWTVTSAPHRNIGSVCTSSDGKWIGALGSATYISSNFGVTWVTNNFTGNTIACSANGTNWIIASDHIYTSTDAGVTWQTNLATAQWLGGTVSADGDEMVAVGSGQGTWIGRLTPSPLLNIQTTNNNLGISWLLPSTNFILQQSSDIAAINWTAVTNNPTLNFTNLNLELNLPTTATNTFFRLMAQ